MTNPLSDEHASSVEHHADRTPDAVRSPIGFAGAGGSSARLARLRAEFAAGAPGDRASSSGTRATEHFITSDPATRSSSPASAPGRASLGTTGRTEGTAFFTDTSSPMPDLSEYERRKPGAEGRWSSLADGQHWLLANPTYQACRDVLTEPKVDQPLDRLFESRRASRSRRRSATSGKSARSLLKANYDLSDHELAELLSVAPGAESQRLAAAVFEALFGPDQAGRTYGDWVRASLQANGLGSTEIPTRDLSNVLAILVATNRTVPLTRFAEACREVDERANLEALI